MATENVVFGYPVALALGDKEVLVVGAGPVGARKVAGLAAAGARVRVVATTVSDDLDPELISELQTRPFQPEDVIGAQLVIAATGDRNVDAAVAQAARDRGIWVNAADQPEDCDFVLPAVARRGPVSIAVSTDGRSPALAQRVRDVTGRYLSEDVAHLAEELAVLRRQLRAEGRSSMSVDWGELIDPVLPTPEIGA